MLLTENNKPKYKKKSTKKGLKRANHKHIYEEGLVDNETYAYRVKYCIICGRIDKSILFETEEYEKNSKYHRYLSREEVLDKYKDLKKFKVSGSYVKRVIEE